MPTATYPFDTTGKAETNLVSNELHTLTEVNSNTYRLLIPVAAPFYLKNLKLEYIDQLGNSREMKESVDYYNALIYMSASRSVGQPVYGAWAISNKLLNGTIRAQYQTVGGPWVADRAYVYQQLLETNANPRTVFWDQLTNVQQLFPPADHTENIGDFTGHEAILAALEGIRQAILASPNTVPAELMAHINTEGNPHKTSKNDLGLDNIANLPLATDEEVLQMADQQKYITLAQLSKLLKSKGID